MQGCDYQSIVSEEISTAINAHTLFEAIRRSYLDRADQRLLRA